MSAGFQPQVGIPTKKELPILGEQEQKYCWIAIGVLCLGVLVAYLNMIAGETGQSLMFSWSSRFFSRALAITAAPCFSFKA